MTTPEKQRWPREEARAVANEIKAALAPFCIRIEIAGSIRRMRPQVGDIEILFIPRIEMRLDPTSLFPEELPHDTAVEKINAMLRDGIITKRLSIDEREAWGPKNKLAVHAASGIPVDFFATTVPNWWVSLVIRTGPKSFNLKLTTGANAKGAHLNAYGEGISLQDKQIIPATSEQHVCELCGVPYAEPHDRE